MKTVLTPLYSDLRIDVSDCPDLRLYPFFLRAPGLSGDTEVVEFGDGYRHLYNSSTRNEALSWKFSDLINFINSTRSTSFVIGRGGMFRGIPNKEVVRNFTYSRENGINDESNYIYLNEEEQITTERVRNCYRSPNAPFYNTPLCDHFGSFYVCNGERNKVLRVIAAGSRLPYVQILNQMRDALCYRYHNSENVGLSGLLIIKNGIVETDVVKRAFPPTPLTTTAEIYNRNNNNITMPLVVHNIMIALKENLMKFTSCETHLFDNYILRTNQRLGNSFVNILTPYTTAYEGYFTVVSKLARIGGPEMTTQTQSYS